MAIWPPANTYSSYHAFLNCMRIRLFQTQSVFFRNKVRHLIFYRKIIILHICTFAHYGKEKGNEKKSQQPERFEPTTLRSSGVRSTAVVQLLINAESSWQYMLKLGFGCQLLKRLSWRNRNLEWKFTAGNLDQDFCNICKSSQFHLSASLSRERSPWKHFPCCNL